MQSQQFSVAVQLHGSGAISNGIVQNFGARWTAGYVPDGAVGGEMDGSLPYPQNGAEPIRLLDLMTSLGAQTGEPHLEFPLTDADRNELAQSGLAIGLTAGSYICIHPGARFRDKCWPPQRFALIADRLAQEFGLKIVLTGSAREIDLTNAVAEYMTMPSINTASPLSIGAMAALMHGARLLVCNDTGVSHIAAGLGLKSVVIFNKADMERWAPLDRHLHRCLWDPGGERVDDVLAQARSLLSQTD
jgi:ADP-heptose:LPS heptosyltransferase